MPKPESAVQQFRLGVAVFLVLLAGAARAGDWDFGLGIASDVLIRGVALNSHAVVPHAAVDYYDTQGWFLGLAADLVDPDEYHPESAQLLARAGYAWSPLQDWSAQLGYLHYAYPASDYLRDYAYDEFSASLAWRDMLAFTVSLSPNTKFGWTPRAPTAACDLTARYPVSEYVGLVAGIGYRDLHRLFDTGYTYGNAGVELRLAKVQFGLAYIATSADAKRLFGSKAANRWSGSAIWHF